MHGFNCGQRHQDCSLILQNFYTYSYPACHRRTERKSACMPACQGGKVFIKVMELNKITRIPPSHLDPFLSLYIIIFHCFLSNVHSGMTIYGMYTVLTGHISCCACVVKSNVANLLGQEMYDEPAYGNYNCFLYVCVYTPSYCLV